MQVWVDVLVCMYVRTSNCYRCHYCRCFSCCFDVAVVAVVVGRSADRQPALVGGDKQREVVLQRMDGN